MDKEQLLQEGFKEIKLISAKDNKTIIFTDYMINKEGQIWSFKTDKILDGTFRHGYKTYGLYTTENGKNKETSIGVHVLIASTFFEEVKINNIEDENTFQQVHHINHNSNDNRPENLLWISKVEHNQLHSKSDITRKKKSENHVDFSGENHPMFGKHHTEKTRKKMSKSRKDKYTGENHPRSKAVIAYTDSGSYYKEFAYARDAERELGVSSSNICNCVKGKLKSTGKYNGEPIRWRYKE